MKRNRPEVWESVRQASKEAQRRSWLTYCTRETVLLLDEGCLQYTSLGIRIGPWERHVNEFKATWRRMDTSEQPRIQVRRSSSPQESPTLVNKRMPVRCLRNMTTVMLTTVMLWNGVVSADREHLEGFKKVVYTRQEQVCDVLQWSRETIPVSIGVGSALDEVKSAWYPMWNRRQLGVEQRRIQLHEGLKEKLVNAEHSEAWQGALLHERFSASEESHSSITCSWRCSACKLRRQWGALQKVWMQKCGAYRPEIRTWRWYQIWRDTSISAEKTIWWRRWVGLGLWDQHARSEEAVIECRAKYSSPTKIQLRIWTRNSVDLWDGFQVASKTPPGSRSPEVSSVRQSRVEPRAWRNSTTSTSGDCQRVRCCSKRLSIPSWTRRAWKDPNAMQGMQCMWSPVRKDKAMTKRWSPVTVWQLFCCCYCVGCCVCCRCVLALCG